MKAWSDGLAAALCAVSLGALIGVSGCGSSSSSGGGGADVSASGTAFKGRVTDATVTIFELRPTGALGRVVGTGMTNAAGEFNVLIPAAEFSGWGIARITDGMFVDEATGSQMTIPQDSPLLGFVDVQTTSIDFAITPMTTIAFSLMQFFAHDPEATIDDSIENALTATENYFGLENIDVDLPADLTAGGVSAGPQADNGIVIAGISKLAETETVPTMVLVTALAEDAQDGSFDGQAFGTDVPLGAGTLSPSAGTSDLAAAIVDFLASPENASGLTDADTAVDDDLAASPGDFDKPIQIQRLVNGFGRTDDVVDATVEALSVPASPQVLIEAEILSITGQTAREIDFEIPSGLSLGVHDLVVSDLDSGLITRLRDAIEVTDSDAAPVIEEVTPQKGPLTGGTFLQIWGNNFGPNTQVEVGGILTQRLAQDFPRWMAVATPAGVAGSVDVTVRNSPGSEDTAPDAFEYVSGDARINPSLPSPLSTIVFGAFRNFVDAADGFTAQAFFGRSSFTTFDQGTFTLTDFTATETAPTVATRNRSGTSFQSNESLAKVFGLFDSVNQESDLIRGFTNEENGVSMGATAFGPAVFFPEPSNVAFDAAVGTYWANGFEANIGLSTLRQKAGWIELDASLTGSASFVTHDRDYTGSSFGLNFEKWRINYNLSATGSFQGTRTIGETTENLSGHFNAGAELGFLIHTSTTGTIGYYLLTPIEHGVEGAGWGGWAGGYLQHEIADDGGGGEESAFESGSYRGLIATTAKEGSSRLAFNRATLITPSNTEGCFSEYVGAVNLDVSPSGRMFSDDHLVGYVSRYVGILLATGAFPNECVQDPDDARPMLIGGATFRESRKSYLSLEANRKQVSIETKFLEVGTTHHQEVATDYFDLTMDASAHPTVTGVEFSLAGTIPELESDAIVGLHKSTVRDETGTVTTFRGDPPHFGVQVGYSFIDDILDLFATQVTQPGGRFDDAEMPRTLASGTLGNDGQVAALRSSDEFLGDGLILLLANRGDNIAEPDYDMNSVGLAFEPNSGGLSEVTSSRTDLGFVGNGTVTTTQLSHSMAEDGLFSSGSQAGLGLNTLPIGQRIRINRPTGGADQEWETFFTPDGNAFAGIDDTPGVDTAQLVLGIRPATSGSFVDDDRALISLEINPQISRSSTLQLQLKPRVGSLMTGEIFTSRRDGAHKILPAQSFVSTAATDVGPGRARVPFGAGPVLDFFFNENDDAIGQEDLTLTITPRITYSFDF